MHTVHTDMYSYPYSTNPYRALQVLSHICILVYKFSTAIACASLQSKFIEINSHCLALEEGPEVH